MRKIIITGGWFRAAGNVFHWRHGKPSHHIFGVGIPLAVLKEEQTIEIEIDGDVYTLDCKKAVDFIRAYNSIKKVGRGKMLGVVSKSILTPVKVQDFNPPVKEPEPAEQGKLF